MLFPLQPPKPFAQSQRIDGHPNRQQDGTPSQLGESQRQGRDNFRDMQRLLG